MLRSLGKRASRRYSALSVSTLAPLPAPFSGEPFVALVWDHTRGSSPEERILFARSLIDGGCLYAVCAGPESEAWHDAFDIASLAVTEQARRLNWHEKYILTAGLGKESLEEAAFFFAVTATSYEDIVFSNYLLLHIGAGAETAPLDDAVRRLVESPAA